MIINKLQVQKLECMLSQYRSMQKPPKDGTKQGGEPQKFTSILETISTSSTTNPGT